MKFKSFLLSLIALSIVLSAAEHRVPLNGIHTYDNSHDWFRTHEETFKMEGDAVDNLSEFSTSLWFRVAKYPVQNMKEHRDMASLFSRGWSQELRLSQTGKLMNFYCLTNREAYFPASPHVFLGHWTHVVTTFSVAQQKVVTYVDGIKQGEYIGSLTAVRPQAKGCRLTVGQAPDHWNPFDGDIADLRWFDHALTEAEVKELFANPLPEIAKQLGKEEVFQKLLKIYPVAAPLGDKMILPDQTFDKKASTVKELHIVLAPGEYEPAALALHAPTDNLHGLYISVAKDLKSASGNVLPVSAIDLKYVQCWYQGGTAWEGINADNNIAKLVPELLVNDPNLIIIDAITDSQYVKLGGSDGQIARNIHAQPAAHVGNFTFRSPTTTTSATRKRSSR